MTTTTRQADPRFPVHEHQQALRQKCKTTKGDEIIGYDVNKLSDEELWHWFAYDYAFRRVALGTRDDVLSTDPGKRWFNADLVARAEVYFSRELGIKAPDLLDNVVNGYRRQQPSAEDIAYVEECCRQIRANIDEFLLNNSRTRRNVSR